MTTKKYRKIPHEVEVLQWTGDNIIEVMKFLKGCPHIITPCFLEKKAPFYVEIVSLEGKMSVALNDYIVKDVDGECHSYKPKVFAKNYEEVESV